MEREGAEYRATSPGAPALEGPTSVKKGVSLKEITSNVESTVMDAFKATVKDEKFAEHLATAFGGFKFEEVVKAFTTKAFVAPSKRFITDERKKAADRASEVFSSTKSELAGTMKVTYRTDSEGLNCVWHVSFTARSFRASNQRQQVI